MGNTIRFTGLSSGLDTESVVKAIMTPYQNKVDTLKKNKVLAEWRKDVYKEMSTKIQNFRNNAVSKLKYVGDLNKSKVTLSQEGAIKVDTSSYKEDGTHRIEVKQLAETATVTVGTIKDKNGNKLTKDSLVTDIAGIEAAGSTILKINGESFDFAGKTISELEAAVKEKLGDEISFKFDNSVGAFLISSNKTGENQSIDLTGTDTNVLSAMGVKASSTNSYEYDGKNAEILYNNGVTISSETNDIEVNGLKFTAVATTTTPITVTVSKDVDSMVEAVKNFVNEYNTLLEEINGKLSADSAKGYDPLTDEEKEAMSEKEIELWENKIKSSLLRNDSTLKDLSSMLRSAMTTDYSKTDAGLDEKCSMLSQLGISSTGWRDKGKLTIDEDALKKAISENGDGVVSLVTTIANKIDQELDARSKSTEFRTYGQYFSDKTQTTNISRYEREIESAQERYDRLEAVYYKKFTAMEQAMQEMSSQSSLFSSM
ncbi:flagellar filament capping protein FliD [Cellulosilyticum sp. ST5]|uniref:flagellar filament capping protein FliD n=1 Tax=Cellulosilyticum sp. ST5 TaxID=3055805 RepID=UPI003977907D